MFVAGLVADTMEAKRWRRDLEIWSAGLRAVGFDRFTACVNGRVADATTKPIEVDELRDATLASIRDAVRDAASACRLADDQLWLVISNHGDDQGNRGCSTQTGSEYFSATDLDEMAGSPARQVIVAGQCGAGHFATKSAVPNVKRACLAASRPEATAYNGECTTVGDWLYVVAARLFQTSAPEPLSALERKWLEAARQLDSRPTLEAAHGFASIQIRSRRISLPGVDAAIEQRTAPFFCSHDSCKRWKLDD